MKTRTIEELRKILLNDHAMLGTWRKVAKKWREKPGTLGRIAVRDYEPKEAHLRTRLGLPAMVPTPACAKCGDVHVSKRCTRRVREYRDLMGMPVEELRRRLEARQ
jgi:hypothetical protein